MNKKFNKNKFKKKFLTLDETAQMKICIKLLRKCVGLWEEYSLNHDLTFRDEEGEFEIELGDTLLIDTIVEVEKRIILNGGSFQTLFELKFFYESTLDALKRDEMHFPPEIEKIFYSVYNLLKGSLGEVLTRFKESVFLLSVIQVIEAFLLTNSYTEQEILSLLDESIAPG